MKRSHIIGLSLFVAITLLFSAAVLLLMARFEVSLPTLINKAVNKYTDGAEDAVLIKPSEKYNDTSLGDIIAGAYPRILTTELQHWRGGNTGNEFFKQRIEIIKQKHLGYRVNCQSKRLTDRLNCYVTTPNEQRFELLFQAIKTFRVVRPTVSGNKGNAWRLAFTIDILKSTRLLSQYQQEALDRTLADILRQYLELLDNDGASLWHSRATLSAQAFLIATVIARDLPVNQQLYRRALGHFHQTYQAIATTETWPSGYNYWINNRAFISVLAFSAYANAHQDRYQRNKIIAVIKRIGLAHIHFVRPDFKIMGWADEGPRIDLKDETAKVIDLIAQLTKEPVFYYFSQAIRHRYGVESYYSSYRWLLPWLYAPEYHMDTSKPAKRQKVDLLSPMSPFLSNNMLFGEGMRNHVAIRSGWQDNDTVISYQAGHVFSHHQHYNAGHFTLFKGAPLLVDAGQYNGSVMTPRRKNIDIRTLSKNSLLIEQPGEIVKPNHLFPTNVAAGGQRLVMPTGSAITSMEHWAEMRDNGLHLGGAKLLSYRNKPLNYVTISSDLTSAYNSTRFSTSGNDAKVKQVFRHMAYLNQYDLLLSYDKILSTNERYRTKWLAHTVHKPKIGLLKQVKGTANDGIFSSVAKKVEVNNGTGQLALEVLAPDLITTTLIGGERYQHYVEDDGDSNTIDGNFYSEGYAKKSWYDQGVWRLEVSPIDQQALTRYVVIMQPSVSTEPATILKKHPLNHSNGGAAQMGDLVVLWPTEKRSWVFNLSENSEQIAMFLDKPRRLILNRKDKPPVLIDGDTGLNLLDISLEKGAQNFVSSAR